MCDRVDYCQVMQSAKKPLKLAWTNPDPMAELYHKDFQIIFKNGDGMILKFSTSINKMRQFSNPL